MHDFPGRLKSSRLFRYVFIGGFSYAIELAALLLLANVLLLSPESSVAYSFWVGLIVSFLLQKYIAFDNKKSDKGTIGRQSILYGTLVLFNYLFTIAFVSMFSDNLGLIVARSIALMLTVSWNYLIYKEIFK